MCLSHWDSAAFNTQFGTNCPGLLIPSTLFPHCWLMPAYLHLVIAILAPTAKKDPIVCHVHSFESLKWKGQPCAAAAKTHGPISLLCIWESRKMCISWANVGFSWTSHRLLLYRLFRSGVLDLISKRTLKLKHFIFFLFVFQTLAAHFMQLQANSASQLWIFVISVSRCSAISQPSCCFPTLSPQAAGGTITSSRLHNNIWRWPCTNPSCQMNAIFLFSKVMFWSLKDWYKTLQRWSEWHWIGSWIAQSSPRCFAVPHHVVIHVLMVFASQNEPFLPWPRQNQDNKEKDPFSFVVLYFFF